MQPNEIIKLLEDESNNATELQASRVVYMPDDTLPIALVAYMRHMESGLRYNQVVRMSTLQARGVANALLIQSAMADPPPPSF